MHTHTLNNQEIDPWKKDLLTINDYNSINTIYGYFQIVYKHIHGINIYNSNTIKNIDTKVRFVYNHFFPNDSNINYQSMIDSLKTLEKKDYDEISHEIIKTILDWRNKDIECYRQIKSIANEINKTKLKFKKILNRDSTIQEAFKIYTENNWEINTQILQEVAKNEFQNNAKQRQTQRQIKNIIQNKPLENTSKKDSNNNTNDIKSSEQSQNQKILRRIQNKINILEFNIWNQLWNKLYNDFITQFNWLIKFSLNWWESVFIDWKKVIDQRYDSFFNAATNKQAAIVFIQQFLHENKPDNINAKWLRYFSYNTQQDNEKYLTNEDITENIAELFIKKIELVRHLDKNT